MRTMLAALAASAFPVALHAQQCPVPSFDGFTPASSAQVVGERLEVIMQPVANLRIPQGFSKVGVLPDGSVGFGRHPAGKVVVLGFETVQSVSIHQEGAQPADFFRSVFGGTSEQGCKYLTAFRLEDEEYRLRWKLAERAEVFAYGTGDEHHFYVIRADRKDHVLNGFVRNVRRDEFEQILSTINLD